MVNITELAAEFEDDSILSMMDSEVIFTLAYFVVSICFILAPKEFETAGLTVQKIFSSYLGSEDFDFVRYHIKRTTITVLVHSFIPMGKN